MVKKQVLLCDGGMGTMLYNKGVYLNACFDELNLTNPDTVKEVQQECNQSGVDIIETNTFGANKYKLKKFGLEGKVQNINCATLLLPEKQQEKRFSWLDLSDLWD